MNNRSKIGGLALSTLCLVSCLSFAQSDPENEAPEYVDVAQFSSVWLDLIDRAHAEMRTVNLSPIECYDVDLSIFGDQRVVSFLLPFEPVAETGKIRIRSSPTKECGHGVAVYFDSETSELVKTVHQR